jgi:DNA mismatch repair ATPase MutS
MKVFLLSRDRDFDLQEALPPHAETLKQDLELNTLFNAMACGDMVLLEVAQKAILSGPNDLDTILYRQDILRDCLNNSSIVRDIHDIAIASIERERTGYWSLLRDFPDTILHRSIEVLQMFVGALKELRNIADEHADQFQSEGFTAFFGMLKRELGDEYFATVQKHLKQLKFRDGVLISAELGQGNKGINYTLRKPHDRNENWIERILEEKPRSYTFHLHPRDENGAKALSELNDRGINLVANALAQSTDHILSFFSMLRTELAFYVGCLNLDGKLEQKGAAMSFPVAVAPSERKHSFTGLYDICLALSLEQKVVSNELSADNRDLVFITGANQGGKSTFLRSVGVAQLMMQCGMFVPAESFCANVCEGIFTHYRREEDTTMKSGKFDEELSRMSEIVDQLKANSTLLFSESFAATNDREGSEIARQIVSALLEKRIKIFFVTHLYEFAHGFYDKNMPNAIFLRAERQDDGMRTFKLMEGEPLQTSYGEDLYDRIFIGETVCQSSSAVDSAQSSNVQEF